LPRSRAAKKAHKHATSQDTLMDAERINLIGNTLQDLHQRVDELRGYL
jgi:hypothetical protein